MLQVLHPYPAWIAYSPYLKFYPLEEIMIFFSWTCLNLAVGLGLSLFFVARWCFRPSKYANEPIYAPTTQPLIGHLIPFFWGGASYLEALE